MTNHIIGVGLSTGRASGQFNQKRNSEKENIEKMRIVEPVTPESGKHFADISGDSCDW